MSEEYKKIFTDSDGLLCIDIEKGFSIWEHRDEPVVHFDTVGSGASVNVSDLPIVIEFLNTVLTKHMRE